MKNKNKLLTLSGISSMIFLFGVELSLANWSVSSVSNFGLPKGTVKGIVTNILLWLLFMLGIVGVIGFAISGIMYLLAAGDESLIGRAKKGMTFSIIGVIVGLAGVVIIQAVDAILNQGRNF